jgi:hypothetical protein
MCLSDEQKPLSLRFPHYSATATDQGLLFFFFFLS